MEISESDSDAANEAYGICAKLQFGPVLVALTFLYRVFATTHSLNLVLQEKSINWVASLAEVKLTRKILLSISKKKRFYQMLQISTTQSVYH